MNSNLVHQVYEVSEELENLLWSHVFKNGKKYTPEIVAMTAAHILEDCFYQTSSEKEKVFFNMLLDYCKNRLNCED